MFQKKIILWIFLFVIIPINIFAYSNFIIPGGQNIGIQVNSSGVLVVGFYKVDNKFIARDQGFMVGDSIYKVNDSNVNNIDDMVKILENNTLNNVKFSIKRENKDIDINLDVVEDDNGIIKTGIYVKDKIMGIGTLTYIDPSTNIFGALGHEIDEKSTLRKFEIKDGKIFESSVRSIYKSTRGNAGEKNADFNEENIYGDISKNEESGIFGKYQNDYDINYTLKVADLNEIKLGPAKIRTVIRDDEVEEFDINILKIDKNDETKNLLFEITDQNLLDNTGGIVQGMSGSPIIQNNILVGAVTHVIVNDPKKGYGIFIRKMLEEGEK